MHVYQSYSVSLCSCFGTKTLDCVLEYMYIIYSFNTALYDHGKRKSVFGVKDTKWTMQL